MSSDKSTKPTMGMPSDYRAGYEEARLVDRETADNYIAHTQNERQVPK